MFDRGATAVLATREIPFMVAVKQEGIYSFEDGEWLLQYRMSENIYKLINLGAYIFGIVIMARLFDTISRKINGRIHLFQLRSGCGI